MTRKFLVTGFIAVIISIDAGTQFTDGAIDVEDLPENHLLFKLERRSEGFSGSSEYLEGFVITLSGNGISDLASLKDAVSADAIEGRLEYPNGATTTVELEIVDHRGQSDVYMKTTLGYFLWEVSVVTADEISFVINWFYTPPAAELDTQILGAARSAIADSDNWRRIDDRRCEDDLESGVQSLFCALKISSQLLTGEFNHHGTAMNTVRFVIIDRVPNNDYEHFLMDFNNAPDTTHGDVLEVLHEARERVAKELAGEISGS